MQPDTNMKQVKTGIAVVANDNVLHWLLPFLESWRHTNSDLPLYLIPYNENDAFTRRVASAYGATIVETDNSRLDALARRLYPLGIHKRNRLRKLLSLVLPLDEVIYLDIDIILFKSLRDLVGLIEPRRNDFIVISPADDYVYNRHRDKVAYLRTATLFNDGFFITSNKVLSLDDFFDAMTVDEKTFHLVRERGGLYAQPLTNFVVHRKGLTISQVPDLVVNASGQSYHKAQGVTFDNDLAYDNAGKEIYFAHWAGVNKPAKQHFFDDIWHAYAARGNARMRQAGIL